MEINKIKKLAKNTAILKILAFALAIVGFIVAMALVTANPKGMVIAYVITYLIASAMYLVSFILHIIVTVEYGRFSKDSKDTVFILLIVGFFVQIIGIVALFFVANSKKLTGETTNNMSAENSKGEETVDNFEKLKQLKELLDSGIITQEEFEKKKMELLALNSNSGLAHIKKSPSEDFDLDKEVEIKMTDAEIKKLFEIERVPNGLAITKYKGKAKDVRIPSTYKGYKIIEIKEAAFFEKSNEPLTWEEIKAKVGNSNIEKVTIPSTVEKIGEFAFFGCKNLKKVTLNEGLKEINNLAFADTNIEEITIPSTVEEIEHSAFFMCYNLKIVTLNEGLKGINNLAFNDTNIEEITIPSTVEKIGYGAFFGCKYLSAVSLNEGLKEIGPAAFYKTSIEEITIPSTLKEIKSDAFANCSELTRIKCKIKKSYVEANKDEFEGLLEKESIINWLNG